MEGKKVERKSTLRFFAHQSQCYNVYKLARIFFSSNWLKFSTAERRGLSSTTCRHVERSMASRTRGGKTSWRALERKKSGAAAKRINQWISSACDTHAWRFEWIEGGRGVPNMVGFAAAVKREVRGFLFSSRRPLIDNLLLSMGLCLHK